MLPPKWISRNNRFFSVQLLLILMVKCSVILPNFEVKFSFPLFFSTKYQSRQKILKWLIREAPDHLKLIGRIRHRHCKLQIWLELCWRKKKNQIIPKVHILSKNSIFCDFSIKTHFVASGQVQSDQNWWKMPELKNSNKIFLTIFKQCEVLSISTFRTKIGLFI